MQVFVGTSGWYYDWNEGGTLDWYLKNSHLNAIELNASFYRFPFPNQVNSWAKKGSNLRWVIKVTRLITHTFKFSVKAYHTWERFYRLFYIMDNLIDYFLFQLPPNLTPNSKKKIEDFIKKTGIEKRFALEVRNEKWFQKEMIEWAREMNISWVSIDAPELSREIYNTSGTVYVRMHGRTAWYSHNYTKRELCEIAQNIFPRSPERVFVFFNNDHNMLKNAQMMLKILKEA